MQNLNIFLLDNSFLVEYGAVFVTLLVGLTLASVISGASYFFAPQANDPEKLSPYECGFEPFEDARNTFDIRFYLVAILFILFDLEACFLFPWSVSLSEIGNLGFWTMLDFIIELTIGFIYAWKIGSLEWE